MITTPHDVYSQTRPLCGVTVIQRGEPSGVDKEHVVDRVAREPRAGQARDPRGHLRPPSYENEFPPHRPVHCPLS